MVYSALSDDSSTVSQFTRRKKITIATGGTSTPVNYQVKLTIVYEPEMEASFADVRFNTKSGGYIDMWQESHTDSTTADIWVELPDAITDPGNDIIYMYYGNPGLSDGSDIGDTMKFGDDFPGSSIDGSKWNTAGTVNVANSKVSIEDSNSEIYSVNTYGSGNILCGYGKLVDVDDHDLVAFGFNNDVQDSKYIEFYSYNRYDGAGPFTLLVHDTADSGIAMDETEDGAYHQFQIVWASSSSVIGTIDGGTQKEITANIPTGPFPINSFVRFNSGSSEFDWIYIRKYIANEPTPSYGTAQHQRRVPTIL